MDQPLSKERTTRPLDEAIRNDSKEIFNNYDALYSYVHKFGLQKTIQRLSELVPLFGDCHPPAHLSGRYAYAIFSTEAFRSPPSECHSGGLHGAIEAYFLEKGVSKLTQDVGVICEPELNPFFRHQCIHGIGHGLMAWSDYELPEALQHCDRISEMKASCHSGVFMENIARGLATHAHDPAGKKAHAPKYLNDDPHFPCTIVDVKYKSACYFYQSSRMMTLFSGDFSKIAAECAKAPLPYQSVCFGSMGRDVGGVHRSNPEAAIGACANVSSQPGRTRCLEGAVQDTFWDPKGQDNALRFCRLLTSQPEKRACYKVVVGRAPQVIKVQRDLEAFCHKVEEDYRADCLEKTQEKKRQKTSHRNNLNLFLLGPTGKYRDLIPDLTGLTKAPQKNILATLEFPRNWGADRVAPRLCQGHLPDKFIPGFKR